MVESLSLQFPRHSYQQQVSAAFAQLGQSPQNVLVFSGDEGLGKTTLRKLLETEYHTQAIAISGATLKRYNEVGVDQAMQLIQSQLKQHGIGLPDFDRVYTYWAEWSRLGQSLDPDRLAEQIKQGTLLSPAEDLLSPFNPTPGIVSSLTWFLLRFSSDYGQQRDILQTLNACSAPYELRQQLPQYLMHLLRLELQDQDRRMVILVDDYEDLLDYQGRCPWLDEMIAVENPSVLWVLFAKEAISALPPAQQIPLEPLTLEESLEWLQAWGIHQLEVAQPIAKAAEGIPFELRCRIEAYQSDPETAADPLDDVLRLLMHDLPDRLLEMVCCLSVTRTWDEELFTSITQFLQFEDAADLLFQIGELPFVELVGTHLWRLHPLMTQFLQQQFSDFQQAVVHEHLGVFSQLRFLEEPKLQRLADAIYHGLRHTEPKVSTPWLLEKVLLVQAGSRNLEAIALLRLVKEMELRLPMEVRAILTTQLGLSQMAVGRVEDAIATLEQGKSLWSLPQNRLELPFASVEFYLADAYFRAGRYSDAQNAALRAKYLRLDLSGVDSLPVAEVLNLLGKIAAMQNQPLEAIDFNQQAVRIYALYPERKLGAVAQLKRSQAIQLCQLNRSAEGLQSCQSALEGVQTALGNEHPEVILCLEQLGSLYESLQPPQFAQAYERYVQALAIGEPLLGADHPVVLRILENVTQLCHKMEQPERAAEFVQRHAANVQIGRFEQTVEVARRLHQIADSLQESGAFRKAEPLYVRSLEINEKVLGINHPQTQVTVQNLESMRQKMRSAPSKSA